jgi:hypothetical protein
VSNSLNHSPNLLKPQHMNENFKLNLFDLLLIYFLTMWTLAKVCKVNWKEVLKRLIQLLKLSKTSTCYIWWPHVLEKECLTRHHVLSKFTCHPKKKNLWGLFWEYFCMLSPWMNSSRVCMPIIKLTLPTKNHDQWKLMKKRRILKISQSRWVA